MQLAGSDYRTVYIGTYISYILYMCVCTQAAEGTRAYKGGVEALLCPFTAGMCLVRVSVGRAGVICVLCAPLDASVLR